MDAKNTISTSLPISLKLMVLINTSLPVSLKLMVLSLKVLQNFMEKSYVQHFIWEFINFSQRTSKR